MWDNLVPKVLTQSQVNQFLRDGYVYPFDCLTTQQAKLCRKRLEAYEASIDGTISESLQIKVHLAFKWLFDLAHHPKLLDAVEDLIGPNILLYLSTFWFKDTEDGKFVSWHQDSAYYGLDPHEAVTLWLAFSDASEKSGCMRVLPGSHRGPDQRHLETFDKNNLLVRGQAIENVDDRKAESMPLKAGQFSLHHERIVHSSRPNMSDDRRLGVSFIFIPTTTRCVIGRRTAHLARGKDFHNYWNADPQPSQDFEPTCMEAIKHWRKIYADPKIMQEGERKG